MRNLGVLCNFGFGPLSMGGSQGGSQGGSENVIKAISEHLTKSYDYKINIYAHNYKQVYNYSDNIKLIPCLKGSSLISQINENDSVLVYSDSLWGMEYIIRNAKQIDCRVSCALVGAYFLQSHPDILTILKNNIEKFNLITHSSITPDYKFCIDNDLPVKVIPNGINIEEFSNNSINFREKYNIKSKNVILSVSQFFFGKGQESLGLINEKLKKYINDFIIVQISSDIQQYPYEKRFLDRAKRNFGNNKCLFLRNIPREDVVSAFNNAGVFANVSGKEVSPIVLRESMAAGLPFISLPVGDVEDFPGVIINNAIEDKKGYKIIDPSVAEIFAREIAKVLTSGKLRDHLIKRGKQIAEHLDWKNIVPKYDEVLSK